MGRESHLPLPARFVGAPGLRLSGSRQLIDSALDVKGKGSIILHIGANDIGAIRDSDWLIELETIFYYLKARYPDYTPIWSDMLPRRKWRYLPKKDAEKRSMGDTKKFPKSGNQIGVQGPAGPWWVARATPCWGVRGATPLGS